ncbi:MAG: HPr family phosphocarrier protein [Microbacteriaceae bacterium]
MSERTAVVAAPVGLHARPAALFAQAAAATGIPVTITSEAGTTVNAASILGILSLGINHGATVTVAAEGEGADEALAALVALLESSLEN